MGWNRAILKEKGKLAFKANYWKCVLAALLLSFATAGGGFSSGSDSAKNRFDESFSFSADGFSVLKTGLTAGITTVMIIAALLVTIGAILVYILALNPLQVGCLHFFTENARMGDSSLGRLGSGFKRYGTVVATMFLRDLYTFLWTLLFIIPGIVKSYEYLMVPYLLADNPNMSPKEAFRESKAMMDCQKWDTFVLDLSFIGWNILSRMTFGILGIFYVNPYRQATHAELYLALKGGSEAAY